jgi:ribose-phosphate pyrophosphokinase
MMVIGLSNSKLLAKEVANKLNVSYFDLDVRHSIDGEMHLKFTQDVKGKRVFLFQSFYPHQNSSLVEVLFAASLARDLNAKEVILIAPYLSYLREDFRSEKNECVSVKILGEILSKNLDSIISVDPHVDLKKYFSIPVYPLESKELIRDYIKKNYEDVLLVGPDENSRKLLMELGKRFIILKKKRRDEFNVSFDKGYNLNGKKVLVVDDQVITGSTMIGAIKYLGLKSVDCLTVHPVMTGNTIQELEKFTNEVISCNTILNETNKINVSSIIAGKIKDEWG